MVTDACYAMPIPVRRIPGEQIRVRPGRWIPVVRKHQSDFTIGTNAEIIIYHEDIDPSQFQKWKVVGNDDVGCDAANIGMFHRDFFADDDWAEQAATQSGVSLPFSEGDSSFWSYINNQLWQSGENHAVALPGGFVSWTPSGDGSWPVYAIGDPAQAIRVSFHHYAYLPKEEEA